MSPISVYGQNKVAAEDICRQHFRERGIEVVILRFFSIFGSPQRKLLFWDLGKRILSGESVITLGGTGSETRDFIHVTDAARAVAMLAVAANPPPVINVSSGHATSIRTATSLLSSTLDVRARVVFSGITRPGDPPHLQADITRLRRLGFNSQVELKAGLDEYATWLRKIGAKTDGKTVQIGK
jgi:UDP-glucose 4-epimerase